MLTLRSPGTTWATPPRTGSFVFCFFCGPAAEQPFIVLVTPPVNQSHLDTEMWNVKCVELLVLDIFLLLFYSIVHTKKYSNRNLLWLGRMDSIHPKKNPYLLYLRMPEICNQYIWGRLKYAQTTLVVLVSVSLLTCLELTDCMLIDGKKSICPPPLCPPLAFTWLSLVKCLPLSPLSMSSLSVPPFGFACHFVVLTH